MEVHSWWREFWYLYIWERRLTTSLQHIRKAWEYEKWNRPNLLFYNKPILRVQISFMTSDLSCSPNFQMFSVPTWLYFQLMVLDVHSITAANSVDTERFFFLTSFEFASRDTVKGIKEGMVVIMTECVLVPNEYLTIFKQVMRM